VGGGGILRSDYHSGRGGEVMGELNVKLIQSVVRVQSNNSELHG
jgi:hypothetical protein